MEICSAILELFHAYRWSDFTRCSAGMQTCLKIVLEAVSFSMLWYFFIFIFILMGWMYKMTLALRPLLIYCMSPSDF